MAGRFKENVSECPESESVELNAGRKLLNVELEETKITNFFTSRKAVRGCRGGGWVGGCLGGLRGAI